MTMLFDEPSPALWLAQLGRLSLGFGLGLALVLLLRRPLRRWLGAQAQFSLWALPPLTLLAVAAAPWLAARSEPMAALRLPSLTVQAWSGPVRSVWQALLAQLQPGALTLLALWFLGALALASWAVAQHLAYRRQLRRGPGHWWAPAGSSPALLGCWRPRLVLPLDFELRFSAEERSLVLAHERGHAARHDNALRLLAWALAALQWFNPLVWLALPRLRQDQELACDAQVLAGRPGVWPLYAQALLKAQGLSFAVPPVATAWQSTHPLIERIAMLKQLSQRPSPTSSHLRRYGGVTLALGLALASWGAAAALAGDSQPAAAAKPGKLSGVRQYCSGLPRPEVPALGLRGEFVLNARFHIGAQGQVKVLQIQGEERIQPAVRQAIEAYQCASGQHTGVELEQEFRFRFK